MGYKPSNKAKVKPIGLPCRKESYNTREDAMAMIKYIEDSRVTRKIRPYQCRICGFWHLTSRQD